jgi:tight adherence protein B
VTATWRGLVLGLLMGGGLLLVLHAWTSPPKRGVDTRSRRGRRWGDLLAEAGLPALSPARLAAGCVASGLASSLVVLAVSRSVVIAAVLGAIASYAPVALVRRRQRQRRHALRAVWPDVIDNLASGVRAGLSLPEALEQIGVAGPEALRGPFRRFAEDYRVSGRFGEALDRLKAELADPVGDRVVEALRVAREVGGNELGRVLRTLSTFLRDDARTRGELESRQSWTVNAARLAVAAPWVLLVLLSTRPAAVAAYDSTAGLVVLLVGAGVSFVAYRLMLRLGRLPDEVRVLR